jgi:hypothetical protein
MAGIWELVEAPGELTLHINITLLRTELTGVALGVRTRADAKANLEGQLGRSLDTAETTDLNAIADNFETGTTTDRLVYAAKVEMALNASELGIVNETQWRTLVGIS